MRRVELARFGWGRSGWIQRAMTSRLSSEGQGLVTLKLDVTQQAGRVVQEGETTLMVRSKPV